MNTTFSFQKALFAFLGFIGLLIAVRIFYTGSTLYLFLVWNIFLAWIPFALSNLFDKLSEKAGWKQGLTFCCWLAFFPNALYIVTDLIHLEIESRVPKWFDAVLLFSASVAGLMMAFISLYRAEAYFENTRLGRFKPVLIFLILFLGSFGVYLGRFLRWNSWDIISNPFKLMLSIGHRIISPFDHVQTWTVTGTLTIFFYLLYLSVKKMPGYSSRANM
jgi:uncharacterized membrane protein